MNRTPIALGGAILAGILLRVPRLGGQGLWADEAFTAIWATLPLPDMLAQARADNQAPLYYFLQSLVTPAPGASEAMVRSLACLAGLLSIPLLFLLARWMFSDRAGLWAAWLLAVSPLHVHYSREARVYTWLTLTAIVAMLCACALHRRPAAGSVAAAAAALLVLAYLHNLGILYGAGIVTGPLLEALVSRDRVRLRAWAFVGALFLIGFLPWALVVLDQSSRMDVTFGWLRPAWEASFPWQPLLSMAALSPGSQSPLRNGLDHIVPAAWLGLALAVALGWRALAARDGRARPLSAAWLPIAVVVPLAAIFIYSCLRTPIHVVGRVDSPLLPFFLLLVAGGIASLTRARAAAAAVAIALLVAGPLTQELTSDTRSQERTIAQFLALNMAPADRLIVTGLHYPTMEHYLGASRPDVAIAPFPPERALHPGWVDWSQQTSQGLSAAANGLAGALKADQRSVWVVQADEPTGPPLAEALAVRFGPPERIGTNYLGLEIQAYR